MMVVWVIAPYSLVEVDRRFRGAYCLHHHPDDGIRTDLRETGLGGVDWIRLAQDRDPWRAVVSVVMNIRVLAPRS
jgi:hypothetical protein